MSYGGLVVHEEVLVTVRTAAGHSKGAVLPAPAFRVQHQAGAVNLVEQAED